MKNYLVTITMCFSLVACGGGGGGTESAGGGGGAESAGGGGTGISVTGLVGVTPDGGAIVLSPQR